MNPIPTARDTRLELLVDAATTRALSELADQDLVGELVMRLVTPWDHDDPLSGILDGERALRDEAARLVTGLTIGQVEWLRGGRTPALAKIHLIPADPAPVTVADVVAAVERVTGSPARARRWLLRPHSRLGGRPVDLFATNEGAIAIVLAAIYIEGAAPP
ncbi:antitoxin Xre/MbcA/ParS toxin-binding domain-containing protein [Roseomonas sp. WA12]